MLTKKDITIILIIFLLGVTVRIGAAQQPGIPEYSKHHFRDSTGTPYMYEIDSYYNYRLTVNYIKNGFIGDTKIKNRDWDLHSHAPQGVALDSYPSLIVYVTALIFGFFNLFKEYSLMNICFWIPAFITPLACVPAYILVRENTNQFGGAVAGILTVSNTIYLQRTLPGFFDKDMFLMLISFSIVLCIFYTLNSTDTKKRFMNAILIIFLAYMYSIAWKGYLFLFFVIVASLIIYSLFYLRKGLKDLRVVLIPILLLLISSLIILQRFHDLSCLGNMILCLIKKGTYYNTSIWPEVFISVSEYTKVSLKDIVRFTGPLVFIDGLFGILLLTLSLKTSPDNIYIKRSKGLNFLFILLIIWILGGIYISQMGLRFLAQLAEPLIISTAIGAGIAFNYFNRIDEKKVTYALSLSLLFIVFIPSIYGASVVIQKTNTPINDDIYTCVEWISKNTDPQTTVISYWNLGHLITAIGNRSVVYDGRLTDVSREFWVDKAFTTDNESLSYGIFRMLSSNGTEAYVKMNRHVNDPEKSVIILENILGLERNDAKFILVSQYNFNEKDAEEILKYTHPDNPKKFVVFTNYDMLNAGYWIFYFGNWNLTSKKGIAYTYSTGTLKRSGQNILSSNGLNINLEKMDIDFRGIKPCCYYLIQKNNSKRIEVDKNSNLCIFVLLDDNKCVVIDKKFENSLFASLILKKNSENYKAIYRKGNAIIWAWEPNK